MEKRDEILKVFDGTNFQVWKFHMEICFEDKELLDIVSGATPQPDAASTKEEKEAWSKKNSLARRMISSSVTFTVLENLINCSTAHCMWSTLCALYQQKSKENIYMVQNSFFEYKMSRGDTITTHVNKVISMGNLLRDLGKPVQEDMLVAKIFCSLPPSYNSMEQCSCGRTDNSKS